MRGLLKISDAIDAVLGAIARFFAWLLPVLVIVIVFDVITRKFGFQLNIFGLDLGSTRLQELEWHLHSIVLPDLDRLCLHAQCARAHRRRHR